MSEIQAHGGSHSVAALFSHGRLTVNPPQGRPPRATPRAPRRDPVRAGPGVHRARGQRGAVQGARGLLGVAALHGHRGAADPDPGRRQLPAGRLEAGRAGRVGRRVPAIGPHGEGGPHTAGGTPAPPPPLRPHPRPTPPRAYAQTALRPTPLRQAPRVGRSSTGPGHGVASARSQPGRVRSLAGVDGGLAQLHLGAGLLE